MGINKADLVSVEPSIFERDNVPKAVQEKRFETIQTERLRLLENVAVYRAKLVETEKRNKNQAQRDGNQTARHDQSRPIEHRQNKDKDTSPTPSSLSSSSSSPSLSFSSQPFSSLATTAEERLALQRRHDATLLRHADAAAQGMTSLGRHPLSLTETHAKLLEQSQIILDRERASVARRQMRHLEILRANQMKEALIEAKAKWTAYNREKRWTALRAYLAERASLEEKARLNNHAKVEKKTKEEYELTKTELEKKEEESQRRVEAQRDAMRAAALLAAEQTARKIHLAKSRRLRHVEQMLQAKAQVAAEGEKKREKCQKKNARKTSLPMSARPIPVGLMLRGGAGRPGVGGINENGRGRGGEGSSKTSGSNSNISSNSSSSIGGGSGGGDIEERRSSSMGASRKASEDDTGSGNWETKQKKGGPVEEKRLSRTLEAVWSEKRRKEQEEALMRRSKEAEAKLEEKLKQAEENKAARDQARRLEIQLAMEARMLYEERTRRNRLRLEQRREMELKAIDAKISRDDERLENVKRERNLYIYRRQQQQVKVFNDTAEFRDRYHHLKLYGTPEQIEESAQELLAKSQYTNSFGGSGGNSSTSSSSVGNSPENTNGSGSYRFNRGGAER